MIRFDSGNSDAYFERGDAWASFFNPKKDFDRAIRDLTEAIKLKPENASFHAGRAKVHYKMEQYDRAIQDYGESLRLSPNDASYLHGRERFGHPNATTIWL